MGTQVKRGYDWRVTFTPNDVGVAAITFDAQSKQLVGFSGEEIGFKGDKITELTEQKTTGKPSLTNATVVAHWDADIYASLKELNQRGNGLATDDGKGKFEIKSLVPTGDGQSVLNCYVLSCQPDSLGNEAKQTMTIVFMPEGGVVANSPTTLTAPA